MRLKSYQTRRNTSQVALNTARYVTNRLKYGAIVLNRLLYDLRQTSSKVSNARRPVLAMLSCFVSRVYKPLAVYILCFVSLFIFPPCEKNFKTLEICFCTLFLFFITKTNRKQQQQQQKHPISLSKSKLIKDTP